MKKTPFVILVFAIILAGCSKKENTSAPSEEHPAQKSAIVSLTGDMVFINVTDTVKASELQKIIDSQDIRLPDHEDVSLVLYSEKEKAVFTLDGDYDFMHRIKSFTDRNFILEGNGAAFDGVKKAELSSPYLDYTGMDSILTFFPALEKLYINDTRSYSKLNDFSFLEKIPSLRDFEILTGQDDKDTYCKMLLQLEKGIHSGTIKSLGLVKVWGALGYPLNLNMIDADFPYELTVPAWYEGKDIAGAVAWINKENARLYSKPDEDSRVTATLNKNQSVLIKYFCYEEGEEIQDVSIVSGMFFEDEDEFESSMEDYPVWYKVVLEDKTTGYIRGTDLRLSQR